MAVVDVGIVIPCGWPPQHGPRREGHPFKTTGIGTRRIYIRSRGRNGGSRQIQRMTVPRIVDVMRM